MIKYHLATKRTMQLSGLKAVACSNNPFRVTGIGLSWEEFKGLSADRKCKRCANSVTSKFRERKDNEILENNNKKERRTK